MLTAQIRSLTYWITVKRKNVQNYLHMSEFYCTFAANFALRMVAIATKFEQNSMLWIYKETTM